MPTTAGVSLPPLEEASRLAPDELLLRLGTKAGGLTRHEAATRLGAFGSNVVSGERGFAPLRRVLQLLFSPLPVLLLALAAVAQLTGEVHGAAVIAVMVLLSVLLAWVEEFRSGRAAERLRAMVHTTATVIRRDRRDSANGKAHEIPLVRVVPGDIVHLAAGDLVPADVRLISTKDLFIDQSSLTGESMPVEKSVQADGPRPPLELPNIGFMGTHVVSGSATALVVATGSLTCFASVAAAIAEAGEGTSFDEGVRRFIWLMIRIMLVMVPLVFLINGLSRGNWVEAFLFAVAVAVGLTPEMLPMIITVNLAKGALAMSRRKVVVKRLNSIQNLGAMDVLCTDKTGTLTQNRVILERHVDVFGIESRRVLELAYLNSHFQSGLKNLLDVAILQHAEMREHVEIPSRYRKIDEVPFDFRRRRMSVMVAEEGAAHVLICKGAVEEILDVCSHVEEGGRSLAITAAHREDLLPVIRDLNEEGFRVIAVAYKAMPASKTSCSGADESGLVLAGYIAFLDPPKETAGAAVQALSRHGVSVKVLTGDGEIVTRKICRMVGIDPGRVVSGEQLEGLNDAKTAELVEQTSVFARLTPGQKAKIIAVLRRNGHIVGYLGDGINDGPALKAADVGVSVDAGADIAKESADIILLEKSLLVLDEGVVEGRRVFANILKYIRMGASSSFGNMLSVVGASAFLPFLPMAPVQILLTNLLYDASQTALPTDNVDPDFLEQPRKWDIGNIGRYVLAFGPISSLFDYATYFALLYLFDAGENASLFQTGWFVESLLSQLLVVHVIRTRGIPFLESKPSGTLLATTAMLCAIGVWLPASGIAGTLGFTPLPTGYWGALAAILACYLTLTQSAKAWLIRRFGLA